MGTGTLGAPPEEHGASQRIGRAWSRLTAPVEMTPCTIPAAALRRRVSAPGRREGQALFFAWMAAAALFPGHLAERSRLDVSGIPVHVLELSLPVMASLFTLLAMVHRRARMGRLAWLTAGTFAYAAVSLACWSSATGSEGRGMAWTLIAASSTLVAARQLVALHDSRTDQLLARMTIALAVIAAGYSAESFLSLGLRSFSADGTFGAVDRVRGPLFGASTGHFILVPALAYAVDRAREKAHGRFWWVVAFVLLLASIGLGSRSAVLALCLFAVLAVAGMRSFRARLAFIAMGGAVASAAVWLVFSRADTDRLSRTEDLARTMTHQVALRALSDAPFDRILLGRGYGDVWNWYLFDQTTGRDMGGDGTNQRWTSIGESLYHPHSVILLAAVELGLPGVVMLAGLGLALWRHRWCERVRPALAAGLIASLLAMVTDLVLFKSHQMTAIWWVYVFGALALSAKRPEPSRSPASPAAS